MRDTSIKLDKQAIIKALLGTTSITHRSQVEPEAYILINSDKNVHFLYKYINKTTNISISHEFRLSRKLYNSIVANVQSFFKCYLDIRSLSLETCKTNKLVSCEFYSGTMKATRVTTKKILDLMEINELFKECLSSVISGKLTDRIRYNCIYERCKPVVISLNANNNIRCESFNVYYEYTKKCSSKKMPQRVREVNLTSEKCGYNTEILFHDNSSIRFMYDGDISNITNLSDVLVKSISYAIEFVHGVQMSYIVINTDGVGQMLSLRDNTKLSIVSSTANKKTA